MLSRCKAENWLLVTDLGSFKKVVVARWIQSYIPHTPRVHEHVIEVPQVYIWDIFGEDFLNFGVELLADILIGRASRLVDQTIDLRIGIETAVCAFGRESVGVKGVFKNIRVFVPADPAQRIKLESAARDIRKKCSELEGANVDRNTHIPQLLLQHRGQQPGGLFGGCLHRQVKANAVSSPAPSARAHLSCFL